MSDGLGECHLNWFLTQNRHVRFVHILSSLEEQVDWLEDDVCYYDSYQERIEYLGSVLRSSEDYSFCLREWKDNLKDFFEKNGGSYQSVTEKTLICQFHDELVSIGG